MGSVNTHTILGRLGKDPEIRQYSQGGRVANFSVATSKSWKDRDGNKKEKTTWHNVACFNDNLCGIIERYLKKGSRVYIQGEIQKRDWEDKDGNNRVSVETVIPKFGGTLTLLDGREGGGDSNRGQSQSNNSNYDNGLSQGGYDDSDLIPF